jgi:hypothetical protein
LQECDETTQFECGEEDVVNLQSQILLGWSEGLEGTARRPSSATTWTKAKDDAPIFVVIGCLPTDAKQEPLVKNEKRS